MEEFDNIKSKKYLPRTVNVLLFLEDIGSYILDNMKPKSLTVVAVPPDNTFEYKHWTTRAY